ncbi:MAG TPA: hypothetical protein VLH85_08920 [Levilinea sp.]|nr:hypothetical protein [Levilinea sp.]
MLDDDLLALELYSRELGMDYDVVTSSCVRESLEHLKVLQPDVVVIEPATNDDSGWKVLDAVLLMKRPPNVILCSTQDYPRRYPGTAIDRYLVKPVLPVALHSLVDQIIAWRLNHLHPRLEQD